MENHSTRLYQTVISETKIIINELKLAKPPANKKPSHKKKNGHRDCSRWAHDELTVTKMVTASHDWAVTWAVIELWPSRDWAVIILKIPWLSCDLAVTELWPSRDWAVTSPWPLLAMTEPWSLGPGAVTTVVTVSSRWAHGAHLFSHEMLENPC